MDRPREESTAEKWRNYAEQGLVCQQNETERIF